MKTTYIKYKNKAFTLIELVVSVLISAVVLLVVFSFTGDTIANLVDVNRKSDSLQQFYSFITRVGSHKSQFIVPSVLVDKDTLGTTSPTVGIGHDVLYFIDAEEKGAMLWGIIDPKTMRLEVDAKYPYYGNKVVGYRLVSEDEIDDIATTPSIIYDYVFFEDKIFENFNIQDFQVELYNSGDLINIDISIIPHYKNDLEGFDWLDVPKEDIIDISLTI